MSELGGPSMEVSANKNGDKNGDKNVDSEPVTSCLIVLILLCFTPALPCRMPCVANMAVFVSER